MADFTSSFAQGVETGSNLVSRARAQRLQEQQVAAAERRSALMEPLQMKAMEQENMLKGLQITQHLQQKDFIVKAEAAFTKAADLIGNATDLADPALGKQVLALFTNVPMVNKDPRFEMILNTLQGAQELKAKIDKPTALPADMQVASRMTELSRMSNDMSLSEGQRQAATEELSNLRSLTAPSGTNMKFDEQGRLMEFSSGKGAGADSALSGANVSKQQDRMLRANDALAIGNELKNYIGQDSVGLQGAMNDAIGFFKGNFPTMLAGIGDDKALEKRQIFKVLARNYSANVVKMFMSDSNISEKERAKLDQIVPSGEWSDDPKSAMTRLTQIQKNIVMSLRRSAVDLNRPVPFEGLKPTEIVRSRYAGTITPEKAAELLKNSPFFEEEKNAARDLARQLEAEARTQATP